MGLAKRLQRVVRPVNMGRPVKKKSTNKAAQTSAHLGFEAKLWFTAASAEPQTRTQISARRCASTGPDLIIGLASEQVEMRASRCGSAALINGYVPQLQTSDLRTA